MRTKQLLAFVAMAIPFVLSNAVAAKPAQSNGRITIDQLIDIKHPSNPIWSPDGRHVAFVWDRAGVSNYYLADANGGTPVALTNFSDGQVGGAFSGATMEIRCTFRTRVVSGKSPSCRQSTAACSIGTTSASEMNIVPTRDASRVAFVRPSAKSDGAQPGADLWIRTLDGGNESKIAHDDISIFGLSWSPDGAHIAYSAGSKTIHHDESPRILNREKSAIASQERTPAKIFVVPAAGGNPVAINFPDGFGETRWADSTHIISDRTSADFKTRTIFRADITAGSASAFHEDTDDKFAGAFQKFWRRQASASPDGKWIAFLSDVDGWDHLYVMPAAGSNAIQITKGHFEAWRPSWSHDSTRIAFDANEADHPGDRHLGIISLNGDPAHAQILYITTGRGTDTEPSWSPDDKRLVYQHTDPHNSADLFAINAQANSSPTRLSRFHAERFRS